MANITLSIPDEAIPRVVSALCDSEGLKATNANAKKALIMQIKRLVRNYETIHHESERQSAITLAQQTYDQNVQSLTSNIEAISIT